MRRLRVFNSISLDGFFTDVNNQMNFAQNPRPDPEWDAFVSGNAAGSEGGTLVFGRVTYEMMASWWPTPAAAEAMPVVAAHMNSISKIVFSRTLDRAAWSNTRLIHGDLVEEMQKLKEAPGGDMLIFGSGNLVSQLAEHGLIDEYQFILVPLILGQGRTMFATLDKMISLKQVSSRSFSNGNILLTYQPV